MKVIKKLRLGNQEFLTGIPVKFIKLLGLEKGDLISLELKGKQIIIEKMEDENKC